MKAETYLNEIIRRETKKTIIASKRLSRRIAQAQVVRAIKEGPDIEIPERRSYANRT